MSDAEMQQRLSAQLAKEKAALAGSISEGLMPELLACRWEAGEIDFAFVAQPWMINLRGAVHGGALATMFEHAFGVVARAACRPGQDAATLNLQLNYLLGVPGDAQLLMRVRVDRIGGSLKFLSGALYDRRDPARALTTASAACTSK